ncbi:MAG: diguanylate cyclase [Thermoanaerobaculia bacterium]
MSRFAEEAATRIVRSLSALVQCPMSVSGASHPDDAHSIALTSLLSIRADRPFRDEERSILAELVPLVRSAADQDAHIDDLEARVAQLQRENAHLLTQNRILSEISARDSLTGLYNRWYVMEKIDSEMNRSLRNGSPVSVLMLDIDHFKNINDSFGHTAGDSVLRTFGQVLRDSCRVYDVPGRYGGEEFCIVLPETRVDNTTVVAERIRERLAASRFDMGEQEISVTASIGIAGMDSRNGEDVVTSSALIDRADRALYSAKHLGRNRVELWSANSLKTNH